MRIRFFSRLPVRLLAFNVILVFLPIAGVLLLDEYEDRLETAEIRDVTHRARLIAAAMAREGTLDGAAFEEVVRRARVDDLRVRLIDSAGQVVADSRDILPPAPQTAARRDRQSLLYRIGVLILRPVIRLVEPPEEPLEVDYFENATRLAGPDIENVLRGREAIQKKISAAEQRSVTIYRMVPIVVGGWTVGAVVASKSTFAILQDLYAVRLRVMRIFIASLLVAVLVTVFFATSIVTPLRQLRVDARSVLDRRKRTAIPEFQGSKRRDEIGELSRALERIMRRLDAHVAFVEGFAGDVVHELKNPLASIRNANEMIADGGTTSADRRRFVEVIDREVARMERLLSGVREISMIDATLVQEGGTLVDLNALVTKIVDGFRLRDGSRVDFEVNLVSASAWVEASEDRLMQVFENILDNAVSFSPAGGIVRVSVESREDEVAVVVSDEGPGIPPTNLPRIFDRFFTYRPDTSRRKESHTGLGLAIVKAIVEAYGGSVSAANDDRGVAFRVILPRVAKLFTNV
jgi:two-component system, OmpR family, sensor histidine kinase ChvG